jgi:glycosyltransferase involved in cell wall biosynthesis
MESLDISVILPIKSGLVRDFDEYFDKAIKSLQIQEVSLNELIIVHTEEETLVEKLKNYNFDNLNVKLLSYTETPNFQSQLNYGIEHAQSTYVSFLEFDDEYSNVWFRNVQKYIKFYPEVDVFLPIVVDVDDKGVFLGFTNEATFAANFSQEIGYLSNETLLQYQNFQTSGCVVKTSNYLEIGGFKPSMKLTFVYEFLLRITYNSAKVMTIPRIGYKHTTMREGSIFWNYKNGTTTMTEDEVKFWISAAKKEFYFKDDRNIKFDTQMG